MNKNVITLGLILILCSGLFVTNNKIDEKEQEYAILSTKIDGTLNEIDNLVVSVGQIEKELTDAKIRVKINTDKTEKFVEKLEQYQEDFEKIRKYAELLGVE